MMPEQKVQHGQESGEKTKVNAFLQRVQNNPYLATIIVIGAVIIAIGSFTDALSKIAHFFQGSSAKSHVVTFEDPASNAVSHASSSPQLTEDLQLRSVVTSGLDLQEQPVDELTEITLKAQYLWVWSRSTRFVRGRTYHYHAEVFDGGNNMVWQADDEFEPERMTWYAWGRFRIDPNRNLPGIWELRVDINGSKTTNRLVASRPPRHP